MSEMLETATQVEDYINRTVGFTMESAHLYAVNADLFAEGGLVTTLAEKADDVYELLASDYSRAVARVSDFIALVTTGWAAPLNEDGEPEGMPSEHHARRRVRLTVLANRESVASVLRFEDDPDNIVTDEGQATGALADAVQDLLHD